MRSFWRGVASVMDIGGTLGPRRDDIPTDEEARRIDREAIAGDFAAAIEEFWRPTNTATMPPRRHHSPATARCPRERLPAPRTAWGASGATGRDTVLSGP